MMLLFGGETISINLYTF